MALKLGETNVIMISFRRGDGQWTCSTLWYNYQLFLGHYVQEQWLAGPTPLTGMLPKHTGTYFTTNCSILLGYVLYVFTTTSSVLYLTLLSIEDGQ